MFVSGTTLTQSSSGQYKSTWLSVGRYVHSKLSHRTLVRRTLEQSVLLHGYSPASSCVSLMARACGHCVCKQYVFLGDNFLKPFYTFVILQTKSRKGKMCIPVKLCHCAFLLRHSFCNSLIDEESALTVNVYKKRQIWDGTSHRKAPDKTDGNTTLNQTFPCLCC